jgi:hypothetical protein
LREGLVRRLKRLAEIVLMKKEIGEYLKALKFARRVIEVPSSELMGPILSRLVGQPRESISRSWLFSLPSVAIRSRTNIARVHRFFGLLDLEEENLLSNFSNSTVGWLDADWYLINAIRKQQNF